ncbi:MAG: hypothetical protein R3B47_01010 [Bacteroidia bacterium]
MSPEFVEIDFDVNYGGFIEIHLFDEDGKKVWIYGRVFDKSGKYLFKNSHPAAPEQVSAIPITCAIREKSIMAVFMRPDTDGPGSFAFIYITFPSRF